MFVYRLLNEDLEVVYVGKTDNLKRRYLTHKKGIGVDTKKDFSKMEYFKVSSCADMTVYEIIFINMYKPKYNSSFKKEDFLCNELKNIAIQKRWVEFKNNLEISAMDMILDKSRGKYKPRNNDKIFINKYKFKSLCSCEKVKVKDIALAVGITANTLSKYLRIGMSEEIFTQVCDFLNCEPGEIV